jgi:hypothetical protein
MMVLPFPASSNTSQITPSLLLSKVLVELSRGLEMVAKTFTRLGKGHVRESKQGRQLDHRG